MEVSDDESQRFMKGTLLDICLVQYLFGNGVLISILDIGKAYGLERTTGAFLMAKYTSLSCFCGILIGRENRRDHKYE